MNIHQLARRLGVALLIVGVWVWSLPLSHAQDGGNVSTAYQLNMRTGPGTTYTVVTVLPAGTALVLEARNADTSWVLGHTPDNAYRGWVSSLYLSYPPGFAAVRLPVSEEIVPAPNAPQSSPAENVPAPEAAPSGGVGAYPNYQMNVRSGPGKNYPALGQIAANTGLVLEARNADASWVLMHTEDGSMRGWLASLYLRFVTVAPAALPVSDEIINVPSAAPLSGTTNSYDGINLGGFDLSKVEGIDLTAYPAVGNATARARSIFLEGRAMGNNPHVIAKVGDCSSEHWYFLKPFSWGEYDLGPYGYLQGVVNQFGESFGYDSQADHNGFNANSVLAPEWANPAVCRSGESPLQCEFRLHKPSVAIIMFGTSDLLVMAPAEFDFYMRQIVQESIDAGVIPILSTFPGNMNFWNRTILYNQIIVRIALDYDIPLINLWLALEQLPNHGLEPDGFHLGEPPYGTSCILSDPYLGYGYNVRNLVTLQTLDNVWRGAMQ